MITDEQLELWRHDPVSLAKACVIRRPDGVEGPIQLSDRQKDVLRALADQENRTVACIWPKRAGKSLLGAIALIFKSLAPDRQSVCLSNSFEQAEALSFDFVGEILRKTPEFRDVATVRRGLVEFPWGARIICVPANERTVAGIGVTGLLLSDELWQAQSEEPYHLLASQCEGAAAQVMLVSQASGRTKHLYRLWQLYEQGDLVNTWLDYMTPEEARRGSPNPYLSTEYIAARKAELPEPLFNLYWLNIWGESGQRLLDGAAVERCFDFEEEIPTATHWMSLRDSWMRNEGTVSLGAGLDRSLPQAARDESVWTLVAYRCKPNTEPQFIVLDQVILPTGSRAEVVHQHKIWTDLFGPFPSTLEVYQSADLEEAVPRAELGTPSAQHQQLLFTRLSRAITEGRLHIPPRLEKLRDQLINMQIDTSKVLASFGAPGQASDDTVYSLVWGMEAAEEAPVASFHAPRVHKGQPRHKSVFGEDRSADDRLAYKQVFRGGVLHDVPTTRAHERYLEKRRNRDRSGIRRGM